MSIRKVRRLTLRLQKRIRAWRAPAVRDERGMTLVEVMIVSGIMMVLALGFATMMTNQTNQQKAIKDKSEFTNISSAVRNTASNNASVVRSFQVRDP